MCYTKELNFLITSPRTTILGLGVLAELEEAAAARAFVGQP